MRKRASLATWNERVKLHSGFLAALGPGLIGLLLLRPLVEGGRALNLLLITAFALAVAGHLA